MRTLAIVLLLCGCAHLLPVEEHGGLAPIPSRMPDEAFVATGAAFDLGLTLLKVKPVPRLAADILAAYTVRAWKPLGRSVDSGVMFLFGVGLDQFVTFIACKGPCHR